MMEVEKMIKSSSAQVAFDAFSDLRQCSPETDYPAMGSRVLSLGVDSMSEELCTGSESDVAAVKVQKVYRSYRTRRRLADTAVVAEELWKKRMVSFTFGLNNLPIITFLLLHEWRAIEYARLERSTISFFKLPETAASRWSRVSLNASKVGKGLSEDSKAQKLAFDHWIEAIDPRHRYGHNLHIYYDEWCKTNSSQPFFYWLDVGDGKEVDLEACPRLTLRQLCIKYLGPQERQHYEYIVVQGKITHKLTGNLLSTSEGSKWIFVMSTCKKLYSGEKKKGKFHHSSFLAGGATVAAGRLVVEDGTLKSISAYSGHYRPSDDRLDSFLSFLRENGVDLHEVQIERSSNGYSSYEDKQSSSLIKAEISFNSKLLNSNYSLRAEESMVEKPSSPEQTDIRTEYKRTLSGGLQSPRADVPKEAIQQRINSKKAVSYQLGHQLSRNWSTGLGPRIGCIADYPLELRFQALEFTELSPRNPPTSAPFSQAAGFASPPLLSPSS